MSIELDGNGNSVRRDPVVANSDLAKQIRQVGRGELVREVETLWRELREYSCLHGGALISQHIDREFSALLSKFKD